MKLLLALFALIVSIDASAKLLVVKTLLSTYPAARQENVVEYEIINKGDSSAINVQLDDRNSFPTDKFDIRKGSVLAKFAVIPANTTVQHHVVIVPLEPQELIDKDVVVDYTDEETGKTARLTFLSAVPKTHNYFYSEKVLSKVIGINITHFFGFGAIVLPLTVLSAFFYWNSAKRYQSSSPRRRHH